MEFFDLPDQRDPLWIPEKPDRNWELTLGAGRDGFKETRYVDNVSTTSTSDSNTLQADYRIWKDLSTRGTISLDSFTLYSTRTLSLTNALDFGYRFNRRHSMNFAWSYEYWNDRSPEDWDYGRSTGRARYTFTVNPRLSTSLTEAFEELRYRLPSTFRPDRNRNTFTWDVDYRAGKIGSLMSMTLVNNDHDRESSLDAYEKRLALVLDYSISRDSKFEIENEYDIFQYATGNYVDDVTENDFRVAFSHWFAGKLYLELAARSESQTHGNRDSINFDNHTDWILPSARYHFTDAFFVEGGWKLGEKEHLDRDSTNLPDGLEASILDEARREGYLRANYMTDKIWSGIEFVSGQREMNVAQTEARPDYRDDRFRANMTFHFTRELFAEFFYDFYKRSNYTFTQYDERRQDGIFKLSFKIH